MNIPLFIAFFVVIFALIYILYCQGFAVLRRTSAIMIVFRHGKNADKATLDSCTGWVKHAGNFVKARHTNSFWMHNYQKGMQK